MQNSTTNCPTKYCAECLVCFVPQCLRLLFKFIIIMLCYHNYSIVYDNKITHLFHIFCSSKVGAKRVFAVEASNVARLANDVVHENNVQHIVQVFHSRIEDFQLPTGVDKVDIIISEWMGFYLLHEGMLDSVIWARDRFLAADGLMMPSSATISLAPCSVPSRFDDWHSVDGVQMKAVGRAIRSQKSQKPEVLALSETALLHEGTAMAWLDLRDVTLNDLEELRFKEVIVVEREGRYQGVCIWFDCEFPIVESSGDSVVLSTSPMAQQTHWMQTVVVLPEEVHDNVEPKDPVAFSLVIKRNAENRRHYNMELTLINRDEIEHSLPCDCIMTKCILTKAHLLSLQANENNENTVASEEDAMVD